MAVVNDGPGGIDRQINTRFPIGFFYGQNPLGNVSWANGVGTGVVTGKNGSLIDRIADINFQENIPEVDRSFGTGESSGITAETFEFNGRGANWFEGTPGNADLNH